VQQKSNNVSSIEDEILRVDIIIDDQYTVPQVPIELGGVRSFILETTNRTDFNIVEDKVPSKKKSKKQTKPKDNPEESKLSPVGMLCKVKFENQTRKEIEL